MILWVDYICITCILLSVNQAAFLHNSSLFLDMGAQLFYLAVLSDFRAADEGVKVSDFYSEEDSVGKQIPDNDSEDSEQDENDNDGDDEAEKGWR